MQEVSVANHIFSILQISPIDKWLDLNLSVLQGVKWIHIGYFNNAIICELIEKVDRFLHFFNVWSRASLETKPR